MVLIPRFGRYGRTRAVEGEATKARGLLFTYQKGTLSIELGKPSNENRTIRDLGGPMTFYFRTIQIGTPKQPGEGIRIGTVRYLPRGKRKDEYSKHNLFDAWLPTLAPSRELLDAYDKGLSLNRVFQRYRREMRSTIARRQSSSSLNLQRA